MRSATMQARELVDALKALGLKHGKGEGGQFTVATEKKRKRLKNGKRYSEFGPAQAFLR